MCGLGMKKGGNCNVRREAYVFGRPMVAPTDGNKISRVAVV